MIARKGLNIRMKQNFSTLRLLSFFIYFISYLKIIPPLYSFRLCVSLYTMFSNAASTRAPSTETRLSPRLSTLFHFGSLFWRRNPASSAHPLALPLSSLRRLSTLLSYLSSHPRCRNVCTLQNAFPVESLRSSSRSTPRVATGFPRTPVLALPLYQEMPRAQRLRPKEIDRSPSFDSCFSLTLHEREKDRKRWGRWW